MKLIKNMGIHIVRIKISSSILIHYIRHLIKDGKIKLILPKYADRTRIVKLVKKSGGLSSVIYTFSLVYPLDGDLKELELVLKIFQRNEQVKCRNEGEILRFLHSKGFPVPFPYVCEVNDYEVFGGPFILMERVGGKPLGKYLKQISGNERLAVVSHFAETLVFLHSLEWGNIAFLRHPLDEYDYARSQAFTVKSLLKNLKVKGNFSELIEWIESNAPLHPCFQYSILHGDMHLDNFLVTEDGKIVFLDWEHPEIGDHLRDVALAYLNFIFALGWHKTDEGQELGEFFIRQYAKTSGQKLEFSSLRFYVISSALIESICYKFDCKQAFNPSFVQKLGVKNFLLFPFFPWYFWWRSRIWEGLIREELKSYTIPR